MLYLGSWGGSQGKTAAFLSSICGWRWLQSPWGDPGLTLTRELGNLEFLHVTENLPEQLCDPGGPLPSLCIDSHTYEVSVLIATCCRAPV